MSWFKYSNYTVHSHWGVQKCEEIKNDKYKQSEVPYGIGDLRNFTRRKLVFLQVACLHSAVYTSVHACKQSAPQFS